MTFPLTLSSHTWSGNQDHTISARHQEIFQLHASETLLRKSYRGLIDFIIEPSCPDTTIVRGKLRFIKSRAKPQNMDDLYRDNNIKLV